MAAAAPVSRGSDSMHRVTAAGQLDTDALMRLCALVFGDKRLSFRAKGLFGLISTHGCGFGGAVGPELAAEYATDGVAAVRAALGELEEFGYLVRVRLEESDVSEASWVYVLAGPGSTALRGAARPPDDASVSSVASERREAPAGGGTGSGERAGERGRAPGEPFLVSGQVQEVLLALPGDLRKALRATARTDRPRALVTAIDRELQVVSSGRLVERVRRRWVSHGYGRLLAVGALRRPVGAAVALVRAGPCPHPQCEEGRLEDGSACRACAEREKDRRAEWTHRGGQAQQSLQASAPCELCGAARDAEGEPCAACARQSKAVAEEVSELVEMAVRGWAAVPGVPVTVAREAVVRAVSRARTDAAEAGASAAGQALAARLAALEEAESARRRGREPEGGHQAGLPAVADRLGQHASTPVGARQVSRADSCPGVEGSGCPEGRPAVGGDGLCVRCRVVALGGEARVRGTGSHQSA